MDYIPSWLQSKPATTADGKPTEKPLSAHFADQGGQQYPAEFSAATETSRAPAPDTIDETQQKRIFNYGPSLAIPLTGAALALLAGGRTSAKRASLVFMAENTHRRPNTVQGWYFYNKTKNYKVMLSAIQGGFKAAGKAGLFTTAYVAIEEAAGLARNKLIEQQSNKDQDLRQAPWNGRWIDSSVAGVSVATAASVAYRLPRPSARRALTLGLFVGAAIGGLRELRRYLGERLLVQQQQSHTAEA